MINSEQIQALKAAESDKLALKERIEKALEDFTNGRACMHVPPQETDVDLVLADCIELLAERDADKALIAEQESTLEREREKSRRMASRITELEAHTHTVTLPDAISLEQKEYLAEIRESLSEQGITLVVGE